jgi:hypothetical protein
MGLQLYDWINYPTDNGLFFRSNLDKIRKKTLFSGWRYIRFGCIIYYAQFSFWFAAGMVMDASINVSMEPFRAFVGVNLPATDQRVCNAKFFLLVSVPILVKLPLIFTHLGVQTQLLLDIPDSVKLLLYFGVSYS